MIGFMCEIFCIYLFVLYSDMEAVYRNLEKNSYGFKVTVGKDYINGNGEGKALQHPMNIEFDSQNAQIMENCNEETPNPINMEKRRIITSSELYPRPSIFKARQPIGELNNNPLRNLYCRLLNDAHALEREQLNLFPDDEKYRYYAGRAYQMFVYIEYQLHKYG